MHRKLAARLCRNLPLAWCEVPFDIPPIREAVQWHVTNRNDFAIQWVIGQLRTVAQDLYGNSSTTNETAHGKLAVEFQAHQQLD